VFGIDTTADPVAIRRRIGYLPGEFFPAVGRASLIEMCANMRSRFCSTCWCPAADGTR
jgi:hypothetical protein